MTYFIYIVKLVNSNYFISLQKESINFTNIIYEGLYPIELIKIIEIEEINNNIEIDKIVKEYMIKYGIDKVRGGSYCKKEIDNLEILILQFEFLFLQIQDNDININISNIQDVDNDINIISNICANIQDYQEKINSTNINIDIKELLKNFKINTELNNRIKYLDTDIDNYFYNGSMKIGCRDIVQKLQKEKKEINEQLVNYKIPYSYRILDESKEKICHYYNSYCKLNNIESKKYHNLEIKYYLTKMYNNKQKELLKEFIDKNGSLEDNIQKLTTLHKIKFNLSS